MKYSIALEMGTSNTSVYLLGNGLVYFQASTVAFVGGKKARNVVAVGNAAKLMQGKNPEKTIVIDPIQNGVIADEDATIFMLRTVLRELLPATVLQPQISAIVLIPCGITLEERGMIENVCFSAGIREITLIEKIVASAVGCDLPVTTHDGCFVVNIGGGTTEVAAITLSGIVHGVSVEIGGKKMDSDIFDFVANKYHIQLGLNTIERVKTGIGSLFAGDTATMQLGGQDMAAHTPASVTVGARDIMDAVLPAYHGIADAIESVINLCPPETAANIYKNGVILTGGGALMLGLEQLFNARLKLLTYVAPDPEFAAIVGGGKLLGAPELLAKILEQN